MLRAFVYERISAVLWLSRNIARSHLFSSLSANGGEPGRRGDHFWVRSRIELNLEALACYPRTSKERVRASWNVCLFFTVLHPGQRGDHFWVRSRVELNPEALACHPRTSKERIRAPWNVFFYCYSFFLIFFFLFFFFSFFFALLSIPFEVVFPNKHHTCINHYTSKDHQLEQ